MFLQSAELSGPVAAVLSKYADRGLPLLQSDSREPEDAELLLGSPIQSLFPGARDANAALSGLLLLIGCWEESHGIAQHHASREADYWHAIAHRIEPDPANAGYWFRRVGEHPIFPHLHSRAAKVLNQLESKHWNLKSAWDPLRFIEWCEEGRQHPGSVHEDAALKIQQAEWELLFSWCVEKA